MEENKDLLRITKEDEGMSVHWNIENADEMMAVCVAIATCAKHNDAFIILLLGAIKEMFNNENFAEELDNNCVEMPDFEAILKEHNNE